MSGDNSDPRVVGSPTPEQHRVAAGQFDRANQVVATGNYDYGIHLLLHCCAIDPANLLYRQALRRAEKAKYRNNLRGTMLAWLWSWPARVRMKRASAASRHLEVLEQGEQILRRNPWDVGAQSQMAESAEELGLLDLAVWFVEQARHKKPRDLPLARHLARLYARRGNFTQAMAVWELVKQVDPRDTEAAAKLRELAVNETLQRGNLEGALEDAERRSGPGAAAHEQPLPPAQAAERDAAAWRIRLEQDPTNVSLYLQIAKIYRKAALFEQAHAVLKEGLAATGQVFELLVEMADLEAEPFRRNLAIIEKKLATGKDEELRLRRVQLRKEVNTREIDLYRLKADRFPAEAGYHYELGVRLMRAGQLDEAIKELQAARSDHRHKWQCLFYLGLCFKSRKNWKLARRNLEEALEHVGEGNDTGRKDILYELARGYAEAGDLNRAVEMGNELAHLDYGHRDIGRLLDEWQARVRPAS